MVEIEIRDYFVKPLFVVAKRKQLYDVRSV